MRDKGLLLCMRYFGARWFSIAYLAGFKVSVPTGIQVALHGRIEAVRILLEHGSNPGIRNNNRKHVYALAVDAGYGDVVGLLKRCEGRCGRFLGLF